MLTTTNVLVTFNEPVNQTTVTAANLFLRTPQDTVVPATVTYDDATNTATITPTAALAYSTLYTGVAKAAIKDVAGNLTGAPTSRGRSPRPRRRRRRRRRDRAVRCSSSRGARTRSAPTTRRSCAVKG